MPQRSTAALLLALTVLTAGSAQAQTYPTRQIKIIVGFAPGGIVDQMARAYGDFITRVTGQPTIVENLPGAAGTTSLGTLSRAVPDGYTIGVAISGNLAISPFVQKNMPVDVLKNLTPIASLVQSPLFIAVGPSVPAKTVQEFIAFAKSKPGGVTYGSAGMGSLPHLSAALFTHMAGLKAVHVPYRGASLAIADVTAGTLDMVSSAIGELRAGMDSGKLKVLLVASRKRATHAPDVPTAAEIGLPNYEVTTWLGVVAPNGLPIAAQERLHSLANRMLDDPETQKRLAAQNISPSKMTQSQFAEFLRAEHAAWGRRTKELGIEPR
ncbi:MAG: tripartite tricarboxylate transporter substrate binding protein [Alphaproteobacteria bacterium]|nr:tripartite tricarboxylate transporter substrate binding protein [Alphaproteobacteria bacterium]